MTTLIIAVIAFVVAILTFFSGFGLGTILLPVFVIFFPVDVAIALTGVVHFFNNIFKLILVGQRADRSVFIRFGIPAIIAAFLGAVVLLQLTDLAPLFSYTLMDQTFDVYPITFTIAILLIVFGVLDLIPALDKLEFGKDKLPIGGFLSGFFGGLSGHQGALRSAFLIKAGLSKDAFIGTAVVISSLVDFTRLGVYATRMSKSGLIDNWSLVTIVTLSAIAGAYIGNIVLKKITLKFIKITVGIMLMIIGVALGAGWI